MAKKKNSIGKALAISAGVAAVGAGAYYLLGPKGKKHQKKTEVWMAGMIKEVEKELKKAKSVTKPLYYNAIDTMAKTYSKKYKEYSPEINAFAKKLKGDWKRLEKKASPVVKRAVKKVVKKAKKIAR